jgi:soluble lytic murein transglycosylase-like protein
MPQAAISTVQAQLDLYRHGEVSGLAPADPLAKVWASGTRPTGQPSDFDDLIQSAAERNGVEPNLIKAVIRTESNFNPTAVSRAGAKGLMQLMDFNSRAMGVTNPFDPSQSIEAGSKILRGHLDRYGDVRKALAAYNAGGPTVDRYGGIPPYRETQTYVSRVLDALREYQAAGSGNSRSG